MKIFIPSYRRAGSVSTRTLIPDATICVHEFELQEYQDKHPGPFLTIPDELRGNMSRIRNFILESSDDDEILMMDDDISQIGAHEKNARITLNAEQIQRLFLDAFQMSADCGAHLWGLNLNEAKKFYRQFTPVSFLSPVLGPCFGIRRCTLRFDDRLSLNEDYDFFLQSLRKYRRVLRLNKYHYVADHLLLSGGCLLSRTMNKEIEQSKLMIKKWGSKIVRYKFPDPNPVLSIPIPGV